MKGRVRDELALDSMAGVLVRPRSGTAHGDPNEYPSAAHKSGALTETQRWAPFAPEVVIQVTHPHPDRGVGSDGRTGHHVHIRILSPLENLEEKRAPSVAGVGEAAGGRVPRSLSSGSLCRDDARCPGPQSISLAPSRDPKGLSLGGWTPACHPRLPELRPPLAQSPCALGKWLTVIPNLHTGSQWGKKAGAPLGLAVSGL